MKKFKLGFAAAMLSLLALSVQPAMAITVTPTYTTFGSQPTYTFGGSGIPNNAVAVTTAGGITLGLTAHQRGDNIAVTNNGAGSFSAAAGADVSTAPVAVANYATWNFGFYVDGVQAGQNTVLFFDTNPLFNNDVTNTVPFGAANGQNSWNLGMNFLGGAAFQEGIDGTYGLALVTYDVQGAEIARVAINVNVGNGGASVPDGGTPAWLMAAGLIGLVVLKKQTLGIA